jgi:hypothetical protein
MRKRIGRLLAVALLAAGAGAFAVASPAFADWCQSVPNSRGYGCVEDARHWAYVCDTRADNWGVRIYVRTNAGYWYSAGDGNGSASGCGGRHTTGAWYDQYYTAIQTCSGENGANTWRSAVWYF